MCLDRGLLPYQVAFSSIQAFGHNRHGTKNGDGTPFRGGTGSPSNTALPGPRSTAVPSDIIIIIIIRFVKRQNVKRLPWRFRDILIHPAVWPQQTWTENWGLYLHLGRAAGSPSNTMLFGSRPTSLPSGILIHPAIWPQQIWAKNCGGGLCPFGEGELSPHLT